jgi:hypothetical protein
MPAGLVSISCGNGERSPSKTHQWPPLSQHGPSSETAALPLKRCQAPARLSRLLLRPAYLSQALDCPPPTKDGRTIGTIGEAVEYITNIGRKRELRSHWQRIAKLILAKEGVLTVSRALELALFMDAKLDVSKL